MVNSDNDQYYSIRSSSSSSSVESDTALSVEYDTALSVEADTGGSVCDVALFLSTPFPHDTFRAKLLFDVSAAADAFSFIRPNNAVLRREVVGRLRSSRYDAGICNVKWEATGIQYPGNHEYVDVVDESQSMWRRYIVELDFAAEFEIARPTPEYESFLETLPTVVVVTAEDLKPAVTEAVGWSFRTQGMPVPPFRKREYMLAKWLGGYNRTVDPYAYAPDDDY